jgi:hypothetical protein
LKAQEAFQPLSMTGRQCVAVWIIPWQADMTLAEHEGTGELDHAWEVSGMPFGASDEAMAPVIRHRRDPWGNVIGILAAPGYKTREADWPGRGSAGTMR